MVEMSEELKKFIANVAGLVDGYIYARVHGEPQALYEAALHLIRAGGKRLRPVVVIASAGALGEQAEKALPFAAAVELVHNFTLIHDDIMDRDEVRRGVPTVHKLWGEAMAITAGDLLFSKAFEVLVDAVDKGVPPARVAKAARQLARSSSVVAEGQALDMMFEEEEDIGIEDYLKMIYKKTGALFEASAVLGGLVSTEDEGVLAGLATYGKSLGIAFQIRDDVLSITGEEGELGKPVYNDIREGKKTLPIIYALERLGDEERERLRYLIGRRDASPEELREAAELIKKSGAVDYAEKLAEEYMKRAVAALTVLPENRYRRLLEELAVFAVRRTR